MHRTPVLPHESHAVGVADAILAATTELEGAELKTLNVKHDPMLKGLASAYTKASKPDNPTARQPSWGMLDSDLFSVDGHV